MAKKAGKKLSNKVYVVLMIPPIAAAVSRNSGTRAGEAPGTWSSQ